MISNNLEVRFAWIGEIELLPVLEIYVQTLEFYKFCHWGIIMEFEIAIILEIIASSILRFVIVGSNVLQ